MQTLAQIQATLDAVQADAVKFFESGNKSAGTRVRKAMQTIKSLAQDVRAEVSAKNNS